ncbi:MAG TPA: DUF1501 domain-containing protein [Chthonomonadaceae bacterium]|nr:DUF1501 domain-containing protein [Chthonomonadaceae bacterium]
MNITRRLFMKNGAIALASIGLEPIAGPMFLRQTAFAAETTAQKRKKTLICIFQRGAADGLSIVAPHGDPDLYRHRSTLAVQRPGRANAQNAAIDLDGFFGFHPALAPFVPIFRSGHLAVVHACGSPDTTRSHFDAQDYMESGAPGNKRIADGWLSRTVLACPEDRAKLATAAASPFRAVALGGDHGLPRSLQGDAGALAIPDLHTFGIGVPEMAQAGRRAGNGNRRRGAMLAEPEMQSAGAAAVTGGFESLYENAVGDVLHGTGKESFEAIAVLNKLTPGSYAPASGAVYPAGRFGESLKQVAQLVKANVGVEVAFAEMGGWDTHTNQPARLTQQLREFGQGVAALYNDLGDAMSDVVILTMSEFGRTARQNGNNGTDHGHATCFFALGGAVNGGKVLGKWPGLAPEQLYENRDLALSTDFRAVFGEVAVRHLGAQGLAKIFPGYAGTPADFRGVMRA